MGRAREASAEIFADVTAEKGRRSEAAVLADVRELVGEQLLARGRALVDGVGGHAGKEHAAAEDDRVRRGERSQEPGDRAAVQPGPGELRRMVRREPLRERSRDAFPEEPRNRRSAFSER